MLSKECITCGKIYYKKARRWIGEWEKSKFCSVECKRKYGRVKTKCITCKKEFSVQKCFEGKIICCSKECRKKHRSRKMKLRNKNVEFGMKKGDWEKEKNPRWQSIGTKRKDNHGYIFIKIAEGKEHKNWKREHVMVIEKEIKRELNLKKECVHHIDGNKENNKLSNLCLMTHKEHKQLHQSVFLNLVGQLLEKKIIDFDKKTNKYNLTIST